MDDSLNRRDLLTLMAAGVFATLQLPAAEPGLPLFFTQREFTLLDRLTDLLIPTDDHSPGAHQAGVAAYIDRSVAEAFLPEEKTSWRKGLHAVDELARSRHESAFAEISKDQQRELLTSLAAAEHNPNTEAEKFFTQLKQTTASVYYSSSVGIHQDINYKGNVILQEFVGYDVT